MNSLLMHIHVPTNTLPALKRFGFSCLLLGTALTSTAADTSDSKTVQGTWAPVTAELGGRRMPDAVLKTISLKLHDGRYEVSVAGEPDKGTYTIDSSTEPRSMTIAGTEGPNKG